MSEFTGAFNELGESLRAMREAPPPGMLDVRSELSDDENHVDVTVASGRLEALSIDSRWVATTHPTAVSGTIISTINKALDANQEEIMRRLSGDSPTFAQLEKLVEHTSSDLTAAFEQSLHRMSAK
ncbi:MAG: hypothetical protein L0G99_03615 [Propionibacteriales bacterium]|nr:hypothetical protein [Propionibacteriales bacterium]